MTVKSARDTDGRQAIVVSKYGVLRCECESIGPNIFNCWNSARCSWEQEHVNVFEALVGNGLSFSFDMEQGDTRIVRRESNVPHWPTETTEFFDRSLEGA